MKSSDAKASKCHLNFSSRMVIFIKLVYLSSVIALKWQLIGNRHCYLSEITELKYTSLIKMIILEEKFKWHLEALHLNSSYTLYSYVEPHFMYMITSKIMFDDRVMSRKDFLIFLSALFRYSESKHAKAQGLSKQGQEKQR